MATILGIDVAKKKFDVALYRNNKYRTRSFENSPVGFEALASWLKQNNETQVRACMEATGAYGDALARFLFNAGHTVSVVNPVRIKAYGESELLRTKNDKTDAKLIARFCEAQKPAAWQPDPPEIEHLRLLGRRRDALVSMRTQEMNRLGGPDAVVDQSVQKVINFLNQEIELITDAIRKHISKNDGLRSKRDLLKSIPGVGEVAIEAILSEANGFKDFDSVEQVVAFMGLSPKERQSGTSVKGKASMCKIGRIRLRKALYMPTLSAIQHNPFVAALYDRLRAKSKNGMVIACACMKKLVHIIYGVIKNGKPFDPSYNMKNA
ncbi:MAG: IS110 family transposase [Desulfuromonadales bacterium]|nr:IS110 family transposase [Desulfuromonadales bacterium]